MNENKLPVSLNVDAVVAEDDILDIALKTVRQHLGMEVAYLSEFVDGRSIFRAVSAPGLEAMIKTGQSVDIREVYCQHILDGALPQVIPDTSLYPIATAMPITRDLPIGSHVSVPVYLPDGRIYGMFCCLSPKPNPSLNPRDLAVMETFAGIASNALNATLQRRSVKADMTALIEDAIANTGFEVVLQPIIFLETGELTGFEALSRFVGTPYRTPDLWFGDALTVGRQIELEALAIRKALALLPQLPADVTISVNASPDTVASGVLEALVIEAGPERVILEMTEHAIVVDFDKVASAIDTLRKLGIKVAADDVGAGHSGLNQLLRLRPDIIKLDIELVRGINENSAKRSLVMGMVHFAADIGATIVAEGIETEAELHTLRQLMVHKGQGYFLGRPKSIEGTLEWISGTLRV